jgi:uncharacterized protein (TIGR03437 family)
MWMRVTAVSLVFCAAIAAQSEIDIRSGMFRGRPVTYRVVNGLAILEGDIEVQLEGSKTSPSKDALVIAANSFRWTNATIPYVIDAAIPNPQRINDAIAHWNANTPIRLTPRAGEANWLHFIRENNFGVCFSSIGMIGGEQNIRVDDLCGAGGIIHEIGHTVGLYHEQSRLDRDRYVSVAFENINKTLVNNFNQNVTAAPAAPYDYGSIMHYGRYSDARNPYIPTIETIPAGMPIGGGVALSPEEILIVKSMYGQPAKGTVIASHPTGLTILVDGVPVTAPQTFDWPAGSSHTLEAASPQGDASVRYVFGRWSDEGEAAHTITVADGVSIYSASFVQQFPLKTSVVGSGTITVDPPSDSGFYPTGSVIKLTATPASGFSFLRWTGFISVLQGGLANPTTLRLTFLNANYVANFSPRGPTLVTTDPPGLQVAVDGQNSASPRGFDWAAGSAHTIAVEPAIAPSAGVRYVFQKWSDSGAASHGITAQTPPAAYTASFKTQYQLSTSGGAGGTIRVTPQSSDGFYDAGTTVELTPVPAAGFSFANWTGDLTGAPATRQIVMNDNHLVTANFVRPGALAANSIVHAATLQPGPVSPGQQLVIFGPGIGSGPNTQVLFDGVAAPVLSGSAEGVTTVVPSQIAGRTTTVQIDVNGRRSGTVVVGVLDTRPGLFTADGSGAGLAQALNEDGSANSAANPAARGSVISLFATGAGLTEAVRVSIGGQDADIQSSAAGGFPGILRIDARIPAGIATGSAPVRVVFGYTPSPAGVMISVQ